MLNLPGVKPVEHRDDLGRPTNYRPEYDAQAEKLCHLGATNADLAHFFEVDERTIDRWRLMNESFAVASRVGKEHADERVKKSFFKIANGYEYEEEAFDKHGNRVMLRKVAPPNPAAVMKWLSARTPEFRETQRVEHSGAIKTDSIDLSKLDDDQLSRYMAFIESMKPKEAGDE